MESSYKVSLIPQDMRRTDTVIQIADTFEYLERVVDEVFSTVEKRLTENRNRVNSLSKRVARIQAQVDTLSTVNKATVIFSCTKYPAADVHKSYVSCFPIKTDLKVNKSEKLLLDSSGRSYKSNMESIDEKLNFFHVRLKGASQNEKKTEQPIPAKIISVSDLLCFNSPKNPHYSQLNPYYLQQKQRTLDKKQEDLWANMDAPPQSISARQMPVRREDKNYFYSPNLGEVPTIDVPIDLPDLPGIAEGLRYNLDSGPGIAPSAITSPVLPDLPNIEDTEIKQPDVADAPPPDVVSTNIPEVPVHKEIPKEIPPPPMNTEVPKPPPPPVPPPPPPPDIDPVPEEKPATKQEKKTSAAASSGNELRASLMEAIRAVGGAQKAKLKSATRETKSEQVNKVKPSTGSLMEDLHAKLSMRRKGISGTNLGGTHGHTHDTGNPINNALTRLSTIIPPPPKSDDTETTNTDNEDDWDD